MCGITGLISRQPVSPEYAETVANLNACLAHRGPDGEGTFRSDHVALAMRRLSIIDLSTGWQPLYNEDRSLALVANGEVYNYIELRQSLEGRGHRFSTRSDCETILHLYEEYGDECVHHLRGMYAFALWDSKRRRVLLVRDRVGEKPLYLVERPGEVWFCSELRALVATGMVKPALDPVAVHEYFHFGFVPEPRCPLLGVRKLPAGDMLSIDVDSWNVQQRSYWRMQDAPPIDGNPAELVREELERISELIIRSDVPVGVALSGGLDSSIIAVLAQKNYPGTMQAITIGYEGTPWQDERSMARELAGHLHMPFHEVEVSSEDMVRLFPRMVRDRDEPVSDLSGVGYWMVMHEARRLNLPVMLAGQGGDELFWGYRWVREAAAATQRRLAWHAHNGHAPSLRSYLKVSGPALSYTGGVRWMKDIAGLRSGWRQWRDDRNADPSLAVFYELEPIFREAMLHARRMHTPEFLDRLGECDPRRSFMLSAPDAPVDVEIMRMICESYLRTNGIAQGDRLSMASSVELRLPLVDYRLAEVVVGLTRTQSSVSASPKKWLRDAVKDIMPAFVMERQKRGFTPPWRQWGRALKNAYGELLQDGFLRRAGVLNERAAREMYAHLDPPRFRLPRQLANHAITLELWCRQLEKGHQLNPPASVDSETND